MSSENVLHTVTHSVESVSDATNTLSLNVWIRFQFGVFFIFWPHFASLTHFFSHALISRQKLHTDHMPTVG
jgi:hypothetical protein